MLGGGLGNRGAAGRRARASRCRTDVIWGPDGERGGRCALETRRGRGSPRSRHASPAEVAALPAWARRTCVSRAALRPAGTRSSFVGDVSVSWGRAPLWGRGIARLGEGGTAGPPTPACPWSRRPTGASIRSDLGGG